MIKDGTKREKTQREGAVDTLCDDGPNLAGAQRKAQTAVPEPFAQIRIRTHERNMFVMQ